MQEIGRCEDCQMIAHVELYEFEDIGETAMLCNSCNPDKMSWSDRVGELAYV